MQQEILDAVLKRDERNYAFINFESHVNKDKSDAF